MSTPAPGSSYDVVILGGGAAGQTLALELTQARPQTSILLVEKQSYPLAETVHKVGESTVEIAAHYLRDVLGLEDHLTSEQLAKFGLRVFFSYGDNSDITRRVELGHAVRPPHGVGTYQVDRGRLENALGRRLAALGIPFHTGCRVREVTLRPDQDHHVVELESPEGSETVRARWVVDATGRSSLLKRQLGLQRGVEHHANACWFRIASPIDIDQWSDDPDWQRRIQDGRRELSTNHLMGPGYWVWLIRLASDSISVGIVTDPSVHDFSGLNRFDRAMDWLREHEPQCARVIGEHSDQLLDFRVMKDYAYSAEQTMSSDRWCLAGEAGVFLDPLYSPGLDLIAVSNGLITDLLTHALDGEDVGERAAIHNEIYLLITDGWLKIYQDQYPLMGNARVMLAKVVWDTAAYWAVPGLLYFHDMLRRVADFPPVVTSLARFSVLGETVQRFLREWATLDDGSYTDAFVSFYDFEFMRDLHIGMTAGLDDEELVTQLAANVRLVGQITGQLIAMVTAELEQGPATPQVQAQLSAWKQDERLSELVDLYHEALLVDDGAGPLWSRLPKTEEARWTA
jgi:flavin-dependent dehydrogenase